MKLIRGQETGRCMMTMTGDGTNDPPALVQVANLVDRDSNPIKLKSCPAPEFGHRYSSRSKHRDE